MSEPKHLKITAVEVDFERFAPNIMLKACAYEPDSDERYVLDCEITLELVEDVADRIPQWRSDIWYPESDEDGA